MVLTALVALCLGTVLGCAVRLATFILFLACAVPLALLIASIGDALVSLAALQVGYALGLLIRALTSSFFPAGGLRCACHRAQTDTSLSWERAT